MSIPIEDVAARRVNFADVQRPGGRLPPLHPGEVLREEFLRPLDMSAYALAKALHVPVNRITAILAGERAISANTALRLARLFGTMPEFWINLQGAHDFDLARHMHSGGTAVDCAMTADHGRRTEGQARKIRNAGRGEREGRKPFGSRIRARFAEIGLDEDVPELRGEPARPATFEK